MAPSSAPATPTNRSSDVRPIPDPTVMTTQALEREISALREIIEHRMDGSDRVVALLKEGLDGRQEDIDAAVGHLQTLHEEKFKSVQTQFTERDVRTEQTAKDSKVAVDAALQAAKEAVGKQQEASDRAIAKNEGATTKQIDLISGQIGALGKSMDDKISDLKDRVNLIDGKTTGHKDTKDDYRSLAALVISAVVAVGGLVAFLYHNNTAPGVAVASGTAASPQIVIVPFPTTPAATTK